MDRLRVSCFCTYSDCHGVWIDYVYLVSILTAIVMVWIDYVYHVSILTAIVHWFVDRLRVSCFYTYSDSHGVWIDYVYLVSILTAIVMVCGWTTCILFLYLQR